MILWSAQETNGIAQYPRLESVASQVQNGSPAPAPNPNNVVPSREKGPAPSFKPSVRPSPVLTL